jgi:hypothetical protein
MAELYPLNAHKSSRWRRVHTPIPRFTNIIRSMITARKGKIHKSKLKFPLISIEKIVAGSRLPEKLPIIFPTYVRKLYNHKNTNSITFYDSYFIFNRVKKY